MEETARHLRFALVQKDSKDVIVKAVSKTSDSSLFNPTDNTEHRHFIFSPRFLSPFYIQT